MPYLLDFFLCVDILLFASIEFVLIKKFFQILEKLDELDEK